MFLLDENIEAASSGLWIDGMENRDSHAVLLEAIRYLIQKVQGEHVQAHLCTAGEKNDESKAARVSFYKWK